jgi:hypothetical protein
MRLALDFFGGQSGLSSGMVLISRFYFLWVLEVDRLYTASLLCSYFFYRSSFVLCRYLINNIFVG